MELINLIYKCKPPSLLSGTEPLLQFEIELSESSALFNLKLPRPGLALLELLMQFRLISEPQKKSE